jgi:hypothetical protein
VSFRVPYLTRRVAQSAWESSASVCSSSAVACGVCKPLGRVSLDAHVDEQRREKAEARVPFLLVPFLWARKEKTLAEGRNKTAKQSAQPSKEIPIKTSASATYASYCNQAKYVPCLDSVLRRNDELWKCSSCAHNQPFAGSEHAQRNPCYTLLQNDGQTLCMLSRRCFIRHI